MGEPAAPLMADARKVEGCGLRGGECADALDGRYVVWRSTLVVGCGTSIQVASPSKFRDLCSRRRRFAGEGGHTGVFK